MKGTWKQGSWGQHGVHLGPTGPRWAPCGPHEPCSLGYSRRKYTHTRFPVCYWQWVNNYCNIGQDSGYVLMMTSQLITQCNMGLSNCDANTWIVTTNSFDTYFGDFHDRSCKKPHTFLPPKVVYLDKDSFLVFLYIWGRVWCQKQLSKAGKNNYIP